MKTMVKIFWITAIAVIMAFSFGACEGPMGPEGPAGQNGQDGQQGGQGQQGPQGEPGIGLITEIPMSSGLRGTTWTDDTATGNTWKSFAFSNDGQFITGTAANDAITTLAVVSVVVKTGVITDATTYIVERLGTGTSGTDFNWANEWTQGGYGTSIFHVRSNYLTSGTGTTQFQKVQD